jgi:polyisoprenoid-binding protein YceI
MNSKLLRAIGLIAILACFGGSIAALAVVKDRVHVTVQSEADALQRGPDPIDLARADIAELKGDLTALGDGLGEQLGKLHGALSDAADERARGVQTELDLVRRQVAELQAQVEALRRESAGARDQLALAALLAAPVPEPTASGAAPDVAAASAALEPPTPAAAPEAASAQPVQEKRGFLSFKLPSHAFSFEGRQRWAIVPSLSRAGFDAKSTLHDFSGVTQQIEGDLVADLAQPEQGCSGEVRVQSKTLDTGLADRDAEMRKHLDVDAYPTLRFRLSSFTPRAVDKGALTVVGTAQGTLSIHGVERPVAMPVRISVDASKRLAIEGETRIVMSQFGVDPPSKLGMIKVEDEVKIWIALRARSMGAVRGDAGGE